MIDFLRNWVINIVIVVIFVIIADIILPEGNTKKYVKVIIGTFVLLTIIKPFMDIKDISMDFNNSYLETSKVLNDGEELIDLEVLNNYQSIKAVELYESKLREQIISAVSQKTNTYKDNITVALEINKEQGSKDFGVINNVSVYINNDDEPQQNQKIKKIEIGSNEKVIYKEETEYNFYEKKSVDEIKDILSELLGIPKNIIQVKLSVKEN